MNTGRPREFDRDVALDQAMHLFWANGYEATGVAELCTEMGIGRQSLYNAFGDKEGLFREALERYRAQGIQPVVDALYAPGSGLENVLTVLSWWEDGDDRIQAYGCLMANSIAEFGPDAPGVTGVLTDMLNGVEGAFRHALERAVADGELDAGSDPVALARMLTALGQGLSTVRKLYADNSYASDTISSARAMLVA